MEDLGKAAMRTRHWKQLVRATGGAVNISNEGLTRMTLGQFLELGLQYHADEVRKVVQRATKDVGIEKTLKTYEEIWLSKTFDLAKHTRLCNPNTDPGIHEVCILLLFCSWNFFPPNCSCFCQNSRYKRIEKLKQNKTHNALVLFSCQHILSLCPPF